MWVLVLPLFWFVFGQAGRGRGSLLACSSTGAQPGPSEEPEALASCCIAMAFLLRFLLPFWLSLYVLAGPEVDELYAELLAEADMPSMTAPMAAPVDAPAASSEVTGAGPASWVPPLPNETAAPATPTLGRKPKVRPGPTNLLHELLHGPPTITAAAEDTGHEGLTDPSPEDGATALSGTPAEIFLGYTVNTEGETGEVWVPDDTMVDVMLDSPDSELEELPTLQAQPITGSGSEAGSEPTEDPSNSSAPDASCSTGVPHRPPPAVTPRSGVYVHSQACQAVPATRSVSVQAEGSAIDDAIQKRTMPRPLPPPKHRREGQSCDLSDSCFVQGCRWVGVDCFCPALHSLASMCRFSLTSQAEVMMCNDKHMILTWQAIAAIPCPHVHAPRHTRQPKPQDAAESPGTLVIRLDRLDPTALVRCARPVHGTMLCTSHTAGSTTCRQLSPALDERPAQTVLSEVRVDCCHQLLRRWTQNASLCTERASPSGIMLLRQPPRRGIMQSALRRTHVFNVSSDRFHTCFTYMCKLGSRLCGHRYRAPEAPPTTAAPRPKVIGTPLPAIHTPPVQDMEKLFGSTSDSTSNSDTDSDQANLERRLDVAVEAHRITMHCPEVRTSRGEPAMLVAQLILHAWHRIAHLTSGSSASVPCPDAASLSTSTYLPCEGNTSSPSVTATGYAEERHVRPRLQDTHTSTQHAAVMMRPGTTARMYEHMPGCCLPLGAQTDDALSALPPDERDRTVPSISDVLRRRPTTDHISSNLGYLHLPECIPDSPDVRPRYVSCGPSPTGRPRQLLDIEVHLKDEPVGHCQNACHRQKCSAGIGDRAHCSSASASMTKHALSFTEYTNVAAASPGPYTCPAAHPTLQTCGLVSGWGIRSTSPRLLRAHSCALTCASAANCQRATPVVFPVAHFRPGLSKTTSRRIVIDTRYSVELTETITLSESAQETVHGNLTLTYDKWCGAHSLSTLFLLDMRPASTAHPLQNACPMYCHAAFRPARRRASLGSARVLTSLWRPKKTLKRPAIGKSSKPGPSILRRGRFAPSNEDRNGAMDEHTLSDSNDSDRNALDLPEAPSVCGPTVATGPKAAPNSPSSSSRTATDTDDAHSTPAGAIGGARLSPGPRFRPSIPGEASAASTGETPASRTASILRAGLRARATRSRSPPPPRPSPPMEAPGGPPPPTVGHLPAGPPPPTESMGPTLRPPPHGELRPITATHPPAAPVGGRAAGGHSDGHLSPAGPPAPRPAAITLPLTYSPEGTPSVTLPPDRPTAYTPGSDHQPVLLASWKDDLHMRALQPQAPPTLPPSLRKPQRMQQGIHHDGPSCHLLPHAWFAPTTPALFHGTPEPRGRMSPKPRIIASKAWHLLRRWKFRYLRTCARSKRKRNAACLWCLHDWVSNALTALLPFLLSSLLRSLTHCIPISFAPAKADRGPKPASRTRTRSRLLLSLLFLWQVQASRAASFSSGEPRVGSEATDPGASTSLHSRHTPANPGHYVPTLTGCRKRSFKRAVLRARHFGITRYRGRLCSVHDLLGRGEQSHPDTTSPHRSTPRPPPPGLRCSIMTWNAGGLTVTVWNEFLTWLLKTPHGHDIVCIQETYWRDDFEWDDDHWSYIHHGSHKPKEAGLLMCISKKLAQPHMIKHTPVLVGRLQHVRIFFPKGHQPLDVLHVYQHAWYHQKDDDQQDWWRGATERRHRFLQRLQATVRSFPIRNPLCLIGDFNTSLPHMTGLTGMGRPTKSGPQSDTADLCAFLEVHRLVACNTFGKAPAATFVNESTGAATQIDFIMLRQFHSDRESKKAKLFNWPVAASRKGAQHIPVQASFSLDWKPWGLSSALEIQNNIQPRQVSDALKQDPNLEADFVCNLQVRLPPQPTAAQLDLALKQAWHDTSARPALSPPDIKDRPHEQVLSLWQARAALLQAPVSDSQLHNCFHQWRLLAPAIRAERLLKQAARQRKRDFLNDCLSQAETAAASGNHTVVYRMLKVLAPKQQRKRIQIRTPQGQVQRPAAERDTLVAYYEELYQAPSAEPALDACPVIYTADHCLHALRALPRPKLVLPGAAPGILWALGASAIAEEATRILNDAFSALPDPPQPELTDISLCLLPKPAKIAQQPSDVRPISLLHPLNKIQASMLASMVKPFLDSYLRGIPQYAYVSGRSAPEALGRVFSHLHSVRQLAPKKERMVQRRQQGLTRTECSGGLTFSLDVAKAFDTIPRWVIQAACVDAGIPQHILQHIDAVHAYLRVGINHFGHHGSCRTSRGIRQGCNLAPSLWCLATAFVYKQLLKALGPNAAEILTLFADDVIAQWKINDLAELRQTMSQLTILIATLRHFGMDVSAQKSVILYSLHGRKAEKFLCNARFKRADKWHMRVSPDLDFPIVRQHKYLGVIISYGSFEAHTLEHRTHCASTAFSRLRHILCTKNVLSTIKRVQLWKAIIWPTLKYGLTSLLLSVHEQIQVVGYVARQLRAITGQLAHHTHETTRDFLEKWKFQPLCILSAEVGTNCRRYEAQADLHITRVTQWHALLSSTYATGLGSTQDRAQLTPVDAVISRTYQCPDCPSCFATAGLLQVHRVKSHGQAKILEKRKQAQMQNQVEHALHGVPTCKHCLHEFNGWRNFNSHILLGNCPVLTAATATQANIDTDVPPTASNEPAPNTDANTSELGDHSPVSTFVQTISQESSYTALAVTTGQEWRRVVGAGQLHARMKNFCPECGLYAANPSRIKVHMRAKHKDCLDRLEHSEVLASCVRTRKPCVYCGQHIPKSTFEGTHATGCYVLWQSMYAMLQSGLTPSGLDYVSKRYRHSRWGRAEPLQEIHAQPAGGEGAGGCPGKGFEAAAHQGDSAKGGERTPRQGQGIQSRPSAASLSFQALFGKAAGPQRSKPVPSLSDADPPLRANSGGVVEARKAAVVGATNAVYASASASSKKVTSRRFSAIGTVFDLLEFQRPKPLSRSLPHAWHHSQNSGSGDSACQAWPHV